MSYVVYHDIVIIWLVYLEYETFEKSLVYLQVLSRFLLMGKNPSSRHPLMVLKVKVTCRSLE